MDRDSRMCGHRNCADVARWHPFLYVPFVKGAPRTTMFVKVDLLEVPLPIVVCTKHKLPRHGWAGVTDPRVQRDVERTLHGRSPLMHRAWIAHKRLPAPTVH